MLDMENAASRDLNPAATRTLTQLPGGVPEPKVAHATHPQKPG